jgi:hypothetical protein
MRRSEDFESGWIFGFAAPSIYLITDRWGHESGRSDGDIAFDCRQEKGRADGTALVAGE